MSEVQPGPKRESQDGFVAVFQKMLLAVIVAVTLVAVVGAGLTIWTFRVGLERQVQEASADVDEHREVTRCALREILVGLRRLGAQAELDVTDLRVPSTEGLNCDRLLDVPQGE